MQGMCMDVLQANHALFVDGEADRGSTRVLRPSRYDPNAADPVYLSSTVSPGQGMSCCQSCILARALCSCYEGTWYKACAKYVQPPMATCQLPACANLTNHRPG